MDDEEFAFQEGKADYAMCKGLNANPYHGEPKLAHYWDRGWMSAFIEAKGYRL